MDIQTAAKYMEHGYRVRRPHWDEKVWLSKEAMMHFSTYLAFYDLLADDWEIITEGIVKDFPLTYSD